MSDFLLEIGLEEVPARMIAGAEAELGRRVKDLLARERLLAAEAKVTTYSTPRRLAVLVEGVLAAQADTEEQLTGPSWKVAFKDGEATAAAEAFAKKAGVAVTALEKVTTAKGEYAGVTVKRQGVSATQLLTGELPKEVLGIYWAKNMYWRRGKPERFVRPVRWVVAMLDAAVVPLEIAGIAAGNASRGHRVLHCDHTVVLDTAKSYTEKLRAARVIVDVAERRQSIRKALEKATRTVPGARWRKDEPLVETVVHLTEWPSVILGDFVPEYLALPEEVLVTVMRDHQKYFAVERQDDVRVLTVGPVVQYSNLMPHFLAVLNTEADDEGAAIIRHGNARVLTARFKDARFFWDFDQKTPLTARVESLKHVTFQKELGSYYWKTEQNLAAVKALVAALPKAEMGSPRTVAGVIVDEASLRRATELAKTDLTTELVKEFTELQGIVGSYYALAQGESGTVAQAIKDQYTPASIEDPIPTTAEGQLLGLADRIQTITAMFGIGFAPTGSKDPFALRRAANAIVKILAESELPLTLSMLRVASGIESWNRVGDEGEVKLVHSGQRETKAAIDAKLVADFLRERLSFYLKDVRGFAYDVVNAVLAAGADDVRDVVARVEALTKARESADFAAISAAFKRIKNILQQAFGVEEIRGWINIIDGAPKADNDFTTAIPSSNALIEAEEIALLAAYNKLVPVVEELSRAHNYMAALEQIATLRPMVDAFFDKVMVMTPDVPLRTNRLALIRSVLLSFSGIADFSEIVTA